MKALSDFLPFVAPYAPGCTDPMAEQAVLSACIEFAGRTCLIQNTSYESSVVGQPDYDVEEPPGTQLVRVLQVYYNDQLLRSRARSSVSSAVAMRGTTFADVTMDNGTPTEWFVRDPSTAVVSLYAPPDTAEADNITIVAAHTPTRTTTRVPDILFTDYAEDIAAGAIARLLLMPAQPFTNPVLSKPYRDQFMGAVTSASELARVGLGAASGRVRLVPFA